MNVRDWEVPYILGVFDLMKLARGVPITLEVERIVQLSEAVITAERYVMLGREMVDQTSMQQLRDVALRIRSGEFMVAEDTSKA